MQIIDDAFFLNDIDFIDFGFGNDQGKSRYCDIRKKIATFYLFAPRLLPLTGAVVMSSCEFTYKICKNILEKLNMIGKARQFFRRGYKKRR